MVTTRSADQRPGIEAKTENLTLRSKPENVARSATTLEQSTVSVTPASRKRSKISVNVPPPRKRTRMSHDGAADPEDEASESVAVAPRKLSSESPAVPDNQEGESKAQTDFIQPKEPRQSRPLPKSTQRNKRIKQSISSATANHTRFGSEEPSDDSPSIRRDIEQDDLPQKPDSLAEDDNDDDEAPEIVSTKANPASGPVKQRRKKTRLRKSAAARTSRSAEPTQERYGSLTVGVMTEAQDVDAERLTTDDPVHKDGIVPEGPIDASPALESDDSHDQSFETAQTTRQMDAFATPEEGRSALTSPTLPGPATAHRIDVAPLSFENAGIPVDNLTSDLTLMRVSKPKTRLRTVRSTTVALPSKASSTLEKYRRQQLYNRVDKVGMGKRGGRYKLQSDWPGKRRKFVVGY